MANIEIEINGQTLTATPDQTVIQVADAAGIYIPRFCYHKQLSIAANCRMCLVEIEKAPKPLPACATPVMAGMKVFTKSPKAIAAQRAVMEFLLINHPLDCPICDQGGECELQDLSMGYGSSHSQYDESKHCVADENIGPLIATEMTRCIECTRCVRFGSEIAGLRELGVIGRGEETEISTYVAKAIHSEVSGNIIDLCPVGALTSKPYRFTARAWELDQAPSISPHDCIGSNLNVHTRYGKVMRVVSRENMAINENWIADRDRYSYTGLYHPDRLEEPMARIDGKWQAIEWERAFEMITQGIQETLNEFGPDKLGALASPSSTLEELYLLQKLVRGLGSPHIDHRLREMDTQDQASMGAFPGWALSLDELEKADAILLIGSNLPKEQPLAALRVRKAMRNGATITAINPVDYRFNFTLNASQIVAPSHLTAALVSLVKALDKTALAGTECDALADSNAQSMQLAQQLQHKSKAVIIIGALAQHHPQAALIRYLTKKIATLTGAHINVMTGGANAAGAWLAGAIPHRHAGGVAVNHVGLNAYDMLEKPRKAYLLLNVEPTLDCANPALAAEALKQAKFVVALSLYRNEALDAYADVILPMAPFTETSGTYVNAAGKWQSFKGVAKAFAASRPAWKILRVLGNFLHVDGFGYESSEEVKHEVHALVEKMQVVPGTDFKPAKAPEAEHGLSRIGEVPLYAIDNVVRHANPLQATERLMEGDTAAVRLHPETAAKLTLAEGDTVSVQMVRSSASTLLPIRLDERIAKEAAWIAAGIFATQSLGDLFGKVELQKREA